MNILITGSTGYVGRHLKKRLVAHNVYECNSKHNNLLNPLLLRIPKVDYIFHLAAWTKAGDFCLHHPGEQWLQNQSINTNILDYWLQHQPQAKIICFGTSCAYDPMVSPKTEDKYMEGHPDRDLYAYGMTKRMLLVGLQAIAQQYGLKYLYFVPNTLYGPDFSPQDNHFIFDLIKKIHAAKYRNTPAELWGTGEQKRELVYIDDAIEFVLGHLDNENQIINVAVGHEYPIRHYAELLCNIIGYDLDKVTFNPQKFSGAISKVLDTGKYGGCNYTPLLDGLQCTVAYYGETYEM